LTSGVLRGSWKAINKETQESFAIKSIPKDSFTTAEQSTRFSAEVGLLRRVNNRYIAALIDFIDDPKTYHLVSELPDGISLRDFIEKNGPMSDALAKELLSKLQYVLMYVSTELCIKYLVLNPDVIFVDEGGHLTLFILQEADSILSPPTHYSCLCFAPPELLSRNIRHENSNSWSIGVLTYYILTGKIPFLGENKEETTKLILGSHVEYPESLPEDAKKFIMRALTKNQLMRMPVKDIFSTEFMRDVTPELPHQTEKRRSSITIENKPKPKQISLKKGSSLSSSQDGEAPQIKLSTVHLSYKSSGLMKHSNSKNKFSGATLG
jgi:serine/threonine protein kinase